MLLKLLQPLTFLLFLLSGCSPNKREATALSSDSLNTPADSSQLTPIETVKNEENQQLCKTFKADTASLQNIVETLLKEEEELLDNYYTLRIKSSGHEYGTDATWYFDSAFNVRYYVEDYSMESFSGYDQYVFCNNYLHAFYENTNSDMGRSDIVIAYSFIGLSFTQNDDGGIVGEKSLLKTDYVTNKQRELLSKLKDVLKLIDEENDNDSSDVITITRQEDVEYGPEFIVTETVECSIDRKLLEGLKDF